MEKTISAILFSAALTILTAIGPVPTASAQTVEAFAPIYVDERNPGVFFLIGNIDGRTAFNFKRAVAKYGPPSEIVLTSGGGIVHEGLLLALEIKEMGAKTVVHDFCMSACFFVFMAGAEREIAGDLGVHQLRSVSNSLSEGQVTLSDVADVLNKLDVDREILVLMLQTPADEMHIFTGQEIAQYGLTTEEGSKRNRIVGSQSATSQRVDIRQAVEFVFSHHELWSRENNSALSSLPQTYANRVDFHDNDWTRDQVMRDKIAFAKRWPIRDYKFRPDYRTSTCSQSGVCTVLGEVDWHAHSPERAATSRGTATVEVTLKYSIGGFQIIREKSKVISRR